MPKKLAIAVIHGMGRQHKDTPADTAALSFSRKLHRNVRNRMGPQDFDRDVAWREVYWADVLQPRQNAYEAAMKRHFPFGWLRRFVMHKLSDAASYYPKEDPNGSTYKAVHDRVARTLADLQADVPDGTPLVILAHSLGGHIMSNYIYDTTRPNSPVPPGFQKFASFAGLLTFGCNIPVFVFACDEVVPIDFPGATTPPVSPWWRNYFDRSDPLGYPLGPLGGQYLQKILGREISDYTVNVGFPLIENMTALSHNAYWADRGFARTVTNYLRDVLAAT